MNSTVEPNRLEWVALIRKYVNDEIDEATFGAAHQELRRRHVALENERINLWPVRYDVQLERAYFDGKMSKDEFNKKWKELWGESPRWHDIVYNDLFYLFDRRTENEEVLRAYQNDPDENKRTYFITEKELKEELKRYLKELESCDD